MTAQSPPSTSEPQTRDSVDRVGAVASSLCAAHCAVGALLPAAFSAFGASFLLNEEVEWLFTGIAITFAMFALWQGWKSHRSSVVALLLGLGIVGMLASRFIEEASGHHHGHHKTHAKESEHHSPLGAGTAVGILAGVFLVAGHIKNVQAKRRCHTESCAA